ncbi:hypothetical protein KZZ07_24510 [Mameliella sp. CS4]|uniref:sulfotransferase n=1 Tax=Mameliella sp. CS4 TaxID=2862329 RepID=UPI001C5E6840|nr:sulfotransferase [Mameliella sp. CS4]MBW4985709.1 hypothetical protein [Mameliella sp. CS4]
MKVFQIGFNKCGTSTIHFRLDALGFSAAHLKTADRRYLATVMQDNLEAGRYILAGLEDYDAFSDIEDVREDAFVEGYKFFPQILEQVQDARFILNLRDRERWIASRLDHNDGTYAEALRRLAGLPDLQALADRWRADWDAHVAAVMETIPAGQLLVYNLETDDPSVIDRFLGRTLVKRQGQAPQNFTRSSFSKTLSRLVPKAVKDALPKELNRSFHYLLRKRR